MHGCDAIGLPVGRSINLSNRHRFPRFRIAPRPDSTSPFSRASSSAVRAPSSPRSVTDPVIDNRITQQLARQHARTRLACASAAAKSLMVTLVILNPGSIHLLTEGMEERARRERDASISRDINPGPKGIIVAAPPREERNHHYRRDHPWISRDSIYRRSPTLDHLFLITTAILPPETLLHLSGLPIPVAALYVRVDVRVLLSLSLFLARTSDTREYPRRERASD